MCSVYVVIRYAFPDTHYSCTHNTTSGMCTAECRPLAYCTHFASHSHTDFPFQLPLHSRLCLIVYKVVVCGG